MTPFSDVDTPPGGYKRAEDHVSQIKRIYIRTPILFWTILAMLIWMFVLTVGSAITISRVADNTNGLRAGSCIIVTFLSTTASDQASRSKLQTIDQERRKALAESAVLFRQLSHDIGERVHCPTKNAPRADPANAPNP
jgi:hypothetical protein